MKIIILLCILIVTSCSSTKNQLSIDTIPVEADIKLYDESLKKFIVLGKTPYRAKISKKYKKEKSLLLEISRPGFNTQIVQLDNDFKVHHLNIVLNKEDIWVDPTDKRYAFFINKVGSSIQEINSQIVSQKYTKAMSIVETLINQYPMASIFHDMQASIFFLQGHEQKGLLSLEKSLSLDPNNIKARSLKNKILKRK